MFENRVGNPVKNFVGNPCWELCLEPCWKPCSWNPVVGNPVVGNPVVGNPVGNLVLGTLFWEPCFGNPVVGNPVGNLVLGTLFGEPCCWEPCCWEPCWEPEGILRKGAQSCPETFTMAEDPKLPAVGVQYTFFNYGPWFPKLSKIPKFCKTGAHRGAPSEFLRVDLYVEPWERNFF